MKKLLTLLLVLSGFIAQAQPQFSYKITYSTANCAYEARAVLTGGNFSTGNYANAAYRIPASANFTIALPAAYGNANFTIASLAPAGAVWTEGTGFRAPNANPNYDYHPVSYGGGGFSNAYPAMTLNSELVLFRFTLTGDQCGSGVRPYINGGAIVAGYPMDPTAIQFASAGDAGSNINNSLQIQDPITSAYIETYVGNIANNATPPKPVINSFSVSCATNQATLSVNAANGSCSTGALTFAWTGPAGVVLVNANTSSVTAVAATALALTGNYPITITDGNGCTISRTEVLTGTSCNIVTLPIKLIRFDAVANGCSAFLSWEATQAVGFDRFEVQYSKDGGQFATIGQIARNNEGRYSFSYEQQERKGYYRLKMLDLDGKANYSTTASVTTACGTESIIQIAPNPTTSSVTISGISAGDEVRIMDMMGRLVSSRMTEGNAATIDINQQPAGVYGVLVIHGQTMIKAGQIVKQ